LHYYYYPHTKPHQKVSVKTDEQDNKGKEKQGDTKELERGRFLSAHGGMEQECVRER